MKILGIDYGTNKIGLAFADGPLATPYKVLPENDDAVRNIGEIVSKEKIDLLVVGLSEGEMAEKTRLFVAELQDNLSVPVSLEDETLSSLDAHMLTIASGMKRKKRHELIDAFSAAVILQRFIDTNPIKWRDDS